MARALLAEHDPVPRWLRVARGRLRSTFWARSRLRLGVTPGFAFVAFLATCPGPHPKPEQALLLLCALVVYELPGALIALGTGRRARIVVDALGSRSEVAPTALSPLARLAGAVLGSTLSALVGLSLLALSRGSGEPWLLASLGRAGQLHLAWGALQLLPVGPFALGNLIGTKLTPRARLKQALAGFGLAVTGLVAGRSLLATSAGLVGFSWWLYHALRQLRESGARLHDAGLEPERRLSQIHALMLDDRAPLAAKLARALCSTLRSLELRTRATRALAWAAVGASEIELARKAIAELPDERLEAGLVAAYLSVCGRRREARELLAEVHAAGLRSRQSVQLLADLYYAENDTHSLAALLETAADVLSADDRSAIQRALAASAVTAPDPSTHESAGRPLRHAYVD